MDEAESFDEPSSVAANGDCCLCLVQNSLQYATRVRTIKNDVSKNEANKDMQKLRRQLEYWKEQAGLTPEQRQYVDLEEIADERGEYEAEFTP